MGPKSGRVSQYCSDKLSGIISLFQRCLYNLMTNSDCMDDGGVIGIELLSAIDGRFGFPKGATWLSYMRRIGSYEAGMTLHILLTRIIKSTHQFEHNFVLNFMPLTRLGWQNAKELIMKYSVGMLN